MYSRLAAKEAKAFVVDGYREAWVSKHAATGRGEDLFCETSKDFMKLDFYGQSVFVLIFTAEFASVEWLTNERN
jgi:hypothetical protein